MKIEGNLIIEVVSKMCLSLSFFLSSKEWETTIARWNLLLAGLFNFFEISFKINTNCNFVIVIFSTFN